MGIAISFIIVAFIRFAPPPTTLLASTVSSLEATQGEPSIRVILLEAESQQQRSRIAKELTAVGELRAKAVRKLIQLSADPDPAVAMRALQVLAHISEVDSASIAAVAKSLQSQESGVRKAAIAAIGRVNTETAIAYLQAIFLAEPDESLRIYCIRTLGAMNGPGALFALLAGTHDSSATVRAISIQQLPCHRSHSATIIPTLVVMLQDDANARYGISAHLASTRPVNYFVVKALGRFGQDAKIAVPALQELYSNVSQDDVSGISDTPTDASSFTAAKVQIQAASSVLRISGEDPHTVQVLQWFLESKNEYLRDEALVAIEAAGLSARVLIQDVVKRLSDGSSIVRWQALQTIGTIGTKKQVSHVEELLRDEDSSVRVEAAITLAKLGEDSQQFRNDVLEIASTSDDVEGLARALCIALGPVSATEFLTVQFGKCEPADRSVILDLLVENSSAGNSDVVAAAVAAFHTLSRQATDERVRTSVDEAESRFIHRLQRQSDRDAASPTGCLRSISLD